MIHSYFQFLECAILTEYTFGHSRTFVIAFVIREPTRFIDAPNFFAKNELYNPVNTQILEVTDGRGLCREEDKTLTI